jgi:hypothetical protein
MNRNQDHLTLLFTDGSTGKSDVILEEKSSTWINDTYAKYFYEKKRQFLWGSEKDGHMHLYLYNLDGSPIRQLTKGDWEVIDLAGVDEKAGRVYFTANEGNMLEQHLYRADENGKNLQRITSEEGTHEVAMSPDHKYYIDKYSSSTRPSRSSVCDVNGKRLFDLADQATGELGDLSVGAAIRLAPPAAARCRHAAGPDCRGAGRERARRPRTRPPGMGFTSRLFGPAAGLDAAVVLGSILVICLTSVLLFRLIRRKCGSPLMAIGVMFFVTGGSAIHWLARPHLLTLLFTVIFYSVLERVKDGQVRLLWCLPALMVVWTNVHGGFFVGIILVSAYAAGEILSGLFTADAGQRPLAGHVASQVWPQPGAGEGPEPGLAGDDLAPHAEPRRAEPRGEQLVADDGADCPDRRRPAAHREAPHGAEPLEQAGLLL